MVQIMTLSFFGIDPSTKTGLAQVDIAGNCIESKLVTSQYHINQDLERIEEIVTDTIKWIHERYKTGDLVCIESPAFGSKGRYALQQGTIGTMLRIGMKNNSILWVDAAPTQLKKYICGNHRAKKTDLIEPLKEKYGFTHSDDNVRDAFGLAQIARSLNTGVCLDLKQEEVILKIKSEWRNGHDTARK